MLRSSRILVVLGIAVSAGLTLAAPAAPAVSTDWTGYLFNAAHSSFNAADTAITPDHAGSLTHRWKWRGDAPTRPGQPGPALYSSPTVARGSIYIGAGNGYFYKLDENTGAVQAKVFIGYQPKLTCVARGFIATATVAPDPRTGESTVYIAAPDGYLYALRATNLSTKWRSVIDKPSTKVNDYFQWSSPTVANGKIYVGSASNCDKPLTRGAVVGYNQATGAEIGRFFTVPAGVLGGGVWTSVAVDSQGYVYASTGTQPNGTTNRYDSVSIVKLDGATLKKKGSFTVPDSELGGDGDFGSSPTIFGPDVGACHKNGIFYALNRATMALDWKVRIGAKSSSSYVGKCLASPVWDGRYLYIAGNATTIGGRSYEGSVRRIDPTNGKFLWERGLPNAVLGTPTMNGNHVLAVGTFSTTTSNAVYLVDGATGRILRTFNTGARDFGQPVFANGWLFTTSIESLNGYRLP